MEKCVEALNALAGGGLADPWLERSVKRIRPPGVAREEVVRRLHCVADQVIRRLRELPEDGRVRCADMGYGEPSEGSSRIFLDPNLVSLPPDGVAGSLAFMDLLPPELHKFYSTKANLIREPDELEGRPPRPYLGVTADKYKILIEKLLRNGLIRLQKEKPKVINGVFAVPKDGTKHRLIIDARPANYALKEPPHVELPNPGELANLSYQGRGELFACKSDQDNFYHRLQMPEWLHQYFGLPKVTWGPEVVWPVVRSLPMGWSHSVFIGQAIHEVLVVRAGLHLDCSFQKSEDPEIGDMRHGEYIDDFFGIGSNKELLAEKMKRLLKEGRGISLPDKEAKKVEPGESKEMGILGVVIHSDGCLEPELGKLNKILHASLRMVQLRNWDNNNIEKLLGGWAWILLLQRPLFSILDIIYQCKSQESDKSRPTRRMKQELYTLCSLAPLIRTNFPRRYADVILATDASKKGGGVVYTTATLQDITVLRQGSDHVSNWVHKKQWRTAISHRWNWTEPIHLLEGEAVILGIQWVLRTLRNQEKRVIFLIDMALIGALKKGRSSRPKFNKLCRRVAALVLAGDLYVEYIYVKSEDNPADGPSRHV